MRPNWLWVSFAFLTACAQSGDSAKVFLTIEKESSEPFLGMSNARVSPPLSASTFSCVLMNVMGTGIGNWDKYSASVQSANGCGYVGAISSMAQVQNDATLSATVSKGPARVVQILGLKTDRSCSVALSTSDLLSASVVSGAYEIARTSVDVYGDVAVSLNNSYQAASARDFRCDSISAHSYVLSSGLVGFWRFESSSAADSSGSGNSGTAAGGVTVGGASGTGSTGTATTFDGSNDAISVAYSSALAPSTLTVAAWVKTTNTATTNQKIVSKTENGGYSLALALSFGNCTTSDICFTVKVGGSYLTIAYPISSISNNVWAHLAGTFDGTTSRLYLNGTLVASGTASTPGSIEYGSTNPFCIGAEPNATACPDSTPHAFSGSLDEVGVWSRALSATEVAAVYGGELQ